MLARGTIRTNGVNGRMNQRELSPLVHFCLPAAGAVVAARHAATHGAADGSGGSDVDTLGAAADDAARSEAVE